MTNIITPIYYKFPNSYTPGIPIVIEPSQPVKNFTIEYYCIISSCSLDFTGSDNTTIFSIIPGYNAVPPLTLLELPVGSGLQFTIPEDNQTISGYIRGFWRNQ